MNEGREKMEKMVNEFAWERKKREKRNKIEKR